MAMRSSTIVYQSADCCFGSSTRTFTHISMQLTTGYCPLLAQDRLSEPPPEALQLCRRMDTINK